jgi:hypothetical protein
MAPEVKIEISPTDILQAINSLMSAASDLFGTLSQVAGKVPIPTWAEITDQNAILQAKIDAEKV